jgi:uncharacterized membrane protein
VPHRPPTRRRLPRPRTARIRARIDARAPLARSLARSFRDLASRAAVGATAGIVVASAALTIDGALGWSLPFAADRVQDLLIALTAASLTIAVFALWMRSIVVGLVSGVFHARTLSTFLDDGFQQAIAGWMVGAFSLLVTVTVASPSAEEAAAPPIATLLALTTVVAALLGILLAVRHASERLDTSDLVHQLADRGLKILEETAALSDDPAPEHQHEAVRSIDTDRLGWVRRVDRRALVAALPEGANAQLLTTPGSFVAPGQTLLTVDTAVDEPTADALRATIEVGRARDPASDLGYSIDELTDVVRQAAGPGNDVGTAREALLYLEALLGRVIDRGLPTGHLRDGTRSLTAPSQPTAADHVARAAERLRGTGPSDPVTARSISDMLDRLAGRAADHGDHRAAAALDHVTG